VCESMELSNRGCLSVAGLSTVRRLIVVNCLVNMQQPVPCQRHSTGRNHQAWEWTSGSVDMNEGLNDRARARARARDDAQLFATICNHTITSIRADMTLLGLTAEKKDVLLSWLTCAASTYLALIGLTIP